MEHLEGRLLAKCLNQISYLRKGPASNQKYSPINCNSNQWRSGLFSKRSPCKSPALAKKVETLLRSPPHSRDGRRNPKSLLLKTSERCMVATSIQKHVEFSRPISMAISSVQLKESGECPGATVFLLRNNQALVCFSATFSALGAY